MGKRSRANGHGVRGGRGPLLSACLIVRDEEPVLPACLASLAGVVDEIIVHDTGSTDGSVAIARAAGATVIEGRWDDDFGAARNVALAACSGTWILHVDADETVVCDRRALRRALEAVSRTDDAFLLDVENLTDDGTGRSYTFRACRVFRRERAEWDGRIHEQVRARASQPAVRVSARGLPARIVHRGYLRAEMERHDKVERNLRLAGARADAPDGSAPDAAALLDLGRSLKAAGRIDEAAERCLAAAACGDPLVTPSALHFAASCLLGLGRLGEARGTIGQLRACSVRSAVPDFLDAQLALQEGDGAGALRLLGGIDELVDDRGKGLGTGVLALHIGMAHALRDDWRSAATALAEAVVSDGAVHGNLGTLIDACARAGRPVTSVPGLFDGDLAGMVVEEARRLASGPGAPAHVRAIAAAVWAAADPDAAVGSPAIAAAADVPVEHFAVVLVDLDALAPELLPRFIEAAASDADRTCAMAAVLDDLGAREAATALRDGVLIDG